MDDKQRKNITETVKGTLLMIWYVVAWYIGFVLMDWILLNFTLHKVIRDVIKELFFH